MVETLKNVVEKISEKRCEFGFYNDQNTSVTNDMFLLEYVGRKSQGIGINLRKEYTTLISLYYFYFNNLPTNSIETISFINDLLEKVMLDEEIKKKAISVNYEYLINNEKDKIEDLTGTVVFKINLEIKER